MKTQKEVNEFFNLENHTKLMDSNANYRAVVNDQSFEEGRILFLEVKVVNKEMSHFLFNWLYGKRRDGEDNTPFGCKLETIHFSAPGSTILKDKIQQLLNEFNS